MGVALWTKGTWRTRTKFWPSLEFTNYFGYETRCRPDGGMANSSDCDPFLLDLIQIRDSNSAVDVTSLRLSSNANPSILSKPPEGGHRNRWLARPSLASPGEPTSDNFLKSKMRSDLLAGASGRRAGTNIYEPLQTAPQTRN